MFVVYRVFAIALLGIIYQNVDASPLYRFSKIDLNSGTSCCATFRYVNKSGQYVGTSSFGDSTQATLWTNGIRSELVPIQGALHGSATAVNDQGQVIGSSYFYLPNGRSEATRATLWDGTEVLDLGTLGGTNSGALGINNSSVIVGRSDLAAEDESGAVWHATKWEQGRISDLGTLGGTRSTAVAINESGEIVGISRVENDSGSHATLWRNDQVFDLGTLGGNYSWAVSVNSRGWATGWSTLEDEGVRQAFFWDGERMKNIHPLGMTESFGELITNDGIIWGLSTDSMGSLRATFWEHETAYDLNHYIAGNPEGTGWVMEDVFAVDGRGALYGSGFNHVLRENFFFKLTPLENGVPEPSTLSIFFAAFLAFFRSRFTHKN